MPNVSPIAAQSASILKTANSGSVLEHSFYFWENNSVNRTPVAKDIIEKAVNFIKLRQPRFDELSLGGQINLVRQELRTLYPDKNVY